MQGTCRESMSIWIVWMVMMWVQNQPGVGLRGDLIAIQMCSQACDFVSGWILGTRLWGKLRCLWNLYLLGRSSGWINVRQGECGRYLRKRQRFGMCVFLIHECMCVQARTCYSYIIHISLLLHSFMQPKQWIRLLEKVKGGKMRAESIALETSVFKRQTKRT